MLYGVQTCFNAPVPQEELAFLSQQRFDFGRIDAQNCSLDSLLGMVEDHRRADLIPYVTVASHAALEALGTLGGLIFTEWKNEPDIALGRPTSIPVEVYAEEYTDAAAVAARFGLKLGGPVVSNLNKRGYDYINAFIRTIGGQLPDNGFGAFHRYGNGTYRLPHYLNWWNVITGGKFQSREDELSWAHEVLGQELFCSEWGYPMHEGMSEPQQAENFRLEWDLYERMGINACAFQIHDGPASDREARYGIRYFDHENNTPFGVWKLSAFTVPQEHA